MKITSYKIHTRKKGIHLVAAVVADLHSRPYAEVLEAIERIKPDIILSPGDMLERMDGVRDERNKDGFEFLYKVVKIAPYYYSFGNHELCGAHRERFTYVVGRDRITRENMNKIKESGVHLLVDSYEMLPDRPSHVYIGGLISGMHRDDEMPSLEFAREFAELDGVRILLCHHPEYYAKYLSEYDLDLVISGHAHGGQWRIFGRGVYAPDQGFFPKYTSGLHDGRLLISRGATNNATPIPRLFNPREILRVEITGE